MGATVEAPKKLSARKPLDKEHPFESLMALCLLVYAQPVSARIHHLRTQNGDHEVDFIVEGDDRRVVAVEVKLSPVIEDRDLVHLKWLAAKLGSNWLTR